MLAISVVTAYSPFTYSSINFVNLSLLIKSTYPPSDLILYKMPGMYRFVRMCLCACFLFIKNFNLSYREIKVRRLCSHRAGGGGRCGGRWSFQSFSHSLISHIIIIIKSVLSTGNYCCF